MSKKIMSFAHLTPQEVFDKVGVHLLQQGKRCVNGHRGDCLYRGPKGMSCAAGVLISDDEYHEGLEHRGWLDLITAGEATTAHVQLIMALQTIHDNEHRNVSRWIDGVYQKLVLLAALHDLTAHKVAEAYAEVNKKEQQCTQ